MRAGTLERYATFLAESRQDMRQVRDATSHHAQLEAIAERDARDDANRSALLQAKIQVVVAAVGAAAKTANAGTEVASKLAQAKPISETGGGAGVVEAKITEASNTRAEGIEKIEGGLQSGELSPRAAKRQRKLVDEAFNQTVLVDRPTRMLSDVTLGDVRGQEGFADRLEANGGDLTKTVLESDTPPPKVQNPLPKNADQVRQRLQASLNEGLKEDTKEASEVAAGHAKMKGRVAALHAKTVSELAAMAADIREAAAAAREG